MTLNSKIGTAGFIPVVSLSRVERERSRTLATPLSPPDLPADAASPGTTVGQVIASRTANAGARGATSITLLPPTVAFTRNPIMFASIAFLSLSKGLGDYDRVSLVSVFLALAHGESEFDVTATSSTTSAKGPLQIVKGTYLTANLAGERCLNRGPAGLRDAMQIMFAEHPPPAGKWTTMDHSHPGTDMSLATVHLGLISLYITKFERDWAWSDKGYVYRRKITPNVRTFQAMFGSLLVQRWSGLQAIFTAFHTNGLYWMDKTERSTYKYDNRPSLDAAYQQIFNDMMYVRQMVTAFRDDPTFKGDPGDPPGPIKKLPPDSPYMGGSIMWDFKAIGKFKNLLSLANRYLISSPGAAPDNAPSNTPAVTITSGFGPRGRNPKAGMMHSTHKGLDLRAREGSSVYACADGVIATKRKYTNMGSWGLTFVLKCDSDDAEIRYAHLSRCDVEVGDRVTQGQLLGASGHSGVIQPHLHVEYKPAGGSVANPLSDPLKRYTKTLSPTKSTA